jgi:putative spermidine/putrescine transport system ATP-binding protein
MLTIRGLTRRFATQTILHGIDLSVPEGAVACLVGPSGCGKSTILRLVAGLDVPDGGEIRIGPRLLSAPGWALEPRKRRLNMVFQDYALWPHMTVAQIVGYGLRHLTRAGRDARVSSLLDQMQIMALADRLPAQISGGQQQRVAIARALATDPEVLLLDEPLSNLDVQLRLEMRLEFARLFAEVGKTVLYVTHDPLEACSFADLLVVMKAGRVEQAGPPEALFARPGSAWIATLAGYETRLTGHMGHRNGTDCADILVSGQALCVPLEVLRAGIAPQDAVTVMLRPAALRLTEPVPGSLAGTVTGALFEGRDWRVTLDIGGQTVSVMSGQRLRPGEIAGLSLASDAAVVFPEGAA